MCLIITLLVGMIDVGLKFISNFTSEASMLAGALGPYVLYNSISVNAGIAGVAVGAAPSSVRGARGCRVHTP